MVVWNQLGGRNAELTLLGRYFMRKLCIQLLINRLRIHADIKRYPEIRPVLITRPLFILEMPRSGTTLLHNLLAQDPKSRWLHLWKIASPSPPPEYHNRHSDSRIQKVEKLVQRYNALRRNL